jgi:hypothetical protein
LLPCSVVLRLVSKKTLITLKVRIIYLNKRQNEYLTAFNE